MTTTQQSVDPAVAAERQARHEAWLRLATPGDAHRLMEPLAGTFSSRARAWFQPGQTPAESTGTMVSTWIVGGRFLRQDYRSVGPYGVFEGSGMMGHDNLRQLYTGVWVDNMSTVAMQHAGKYDPATRTFTMLGSFTDPVGQVWHTRQVIVIKNNDEHVFEMFQRGPSGPEYRSLEVVYTRAK